jgi:hypothetical protein
VHTQAVAQDLRVIAASLQGVALHFSPQHRFDALLFFFREQAVARASLRAVVVTGFSCLLAPVAAISATSEDAVKARIPHKLASFA